MELGNVDQALLTSNLNALGFTSNGDEPQTNQLQKQMREY